MILKTIYFKVNENILPKMYWSNSSDKKVFTSATTGLLEKPHIIGAEVSGSEWIRHFVQLKVLEELFNNASFEKYIKDNFSEIEIYDSRLSLAENVFKNKYEFEYDQIIRNKLKVTMNSQMLSNKQIFQIERQWDNQIYYNEYANKYSGLDGKVISTLNENANINVQMIVEHR